MKEHANTKAVKQFMETDGPVLHGILEEYAKDKARFVLLSHMPRLFTNCGPSYIEEFWYFHSDRKFCTLYRYESSYLSHSDPVVLTLNPYFVLFFRFAADIFTEFLMLLALSINPSAPAKFHAPFSPHTWAYKPPKGGASKFHILFSKMH